MDIPGGVPTLEMNALPALCTIPNSHQSTSHKGGYTWHTACSLYCKHQFVCYMFGERISSICDHHFGIVVHAAVTKFGVSSVVLMHVFIVDHGAAIDASPVCYLTSHIHGYRFSNLTLARVFTEVPSVMATAPWGGPPTGRKPAALRSLPLRGPGPTSLRG